jgi:acyl carrier protein
VNSREAITASITTVAPDIEAADIEELDRDEDFREALDLDSMDFLNILVEIKKRTGVEVPERDYPQVRSLAGLEAYLTSARASG